MIFTTRNGSDVHSPYYHVTSIFNKLCDIFGTRASHHYVDTVNGINDSSCWLGGVQRSCKSLSLAVKGKYHTPNSIIAVLQSSLQQQEFAQVSTTLDENCLP